MVNEGGNQVVSVHRQSEVPVAVGKLEGNAHNAIGQSSCSVLSNIALLKSFLLCLIK